VNTPDYGQSGRNIKKRIEELERQAAVQKAALDNRASNNSEWLNFGTPASSRAIPPEQVLSEFSLGHNTSGLHERSVPSVIHPAPCMPRQQLQEYTSSDLQPTYQQSFAWCPAQATSSTSEALFTDSNNGSGIIEPGAGRHLPNIRTTARGESLKGMIVVSRFYGLH